MLWVKSLHLIFMISWFSGLLYLPRLFVYHAMATDRISIERFKIMERKLYYGIITPSGLLTLIFGLWLLSFNAHAYMQMTWVHLKLTCVLLLIIYQIYLGFLLYHFKHERNKHGHVYYRIINEIPLLILAGIVVLVVVKPLGSL